ncbi:DNA/RNA non-specific endonuclease [Gelidibacter salicanalis]|uniref:Endonuclease n=1 Tax=Gelidibacter salicanalis TaxID=291193 RepID=A0A934KWI2_9FLAO|nr:DNA/RNA non-specific endonuclease [Gelidibacter salicanalis]MBJ7881892.1 DNA/RNA non-specific endonuclease [Gelidibacter salicanalis]
MRKRKLYGILAILLVIGVYGYEHFINEKDVAESVREGASVKSESRTFYLPTSTTGQVVHHNGYSLSYSEPHEQAEWVAYELKKSHLSKSNFKRPYFEVDLAVKTGAASWRNYKNSGYDRGHLCPAGDKSYTKEAYDETFLTSNISPQTHDFNSGIWNTLEQKVRYWARKYDGVFVVTGGVLKGDLETIGNERVAVPNQFYKVIYDAEHEKMIAFLMPHRDSEEPLYNFVVPVDSVEVLTGIDFFPELEDALEDKLEASSSYKGWSFN